MSIKFEYLD